MKTVLIPDFMKPDFVCTINGVRYSYPAGTTQEVPDEVADLIENNNDQIPVPAAPPSNCVTSWNDLTDRPFYSEPGEVLPETTVEIDPESGMAFLPDMAIFGGDKCTIKYNGTEYVCVCAESDEGLLGLGNYGMDSDPPVDTGEPFAMAKADIGNGVLVWVVAPLDGSTSVTLSVIGEVHHPVPDKYLPITGADLLFTLAQNPKTGEIYVSEANMDARTAWLRAKSPNTIIRAISNTHAPVLNLFAVFDDVAIFSVCDFESEMFYINDINGTMVPVMSTTITRYTLKAFADGTYSFDKVDSTNSNVKYLTG
jgi:hypothetical protein